MAETVVLALVVSTLSPAVLAGIQGYIQRNLKQQDWDRQDLVAKNLLERQDKIAASLRANNESVARASEATQEKLNVIHKLVNSSMTSAMQSELAAHRVALIYLKRDGAPSIETQKEIAAITSKIETLEASLAERVKADAIAKEQEQRIR